MALPEPSDTERARHDQSNMTEAQENNPDNYFMNMFEVLNYEIINSLNNSRKRQTKNGRNE